jgi:hypothetical protein
MNATFTHFTTVWVAQRHGCSCRGGGTSVEPVWRAEFPGGSGEMVQVGAQWLPKVQRPFFQAEQTPTGNWRLWNASGIRFEFNNLTGAHTSNLTGIVDRAGNRITYVWKDQWSSTTSLLCLPVSPGCSGVRLLDEIRYFTNESVTSAQARFKLHFVWTSPRAPIDYFVLDPVKPRKCSRFRRDDRSWRDREERRDRCAPRGCSRASAK